MTEPGTQDPSIIDDYEALKAMEDHVAVIEQKLDALTALLTGALTDPVDGHTQSILTLARRAVAGQK